MGGEVGAGQAAKPMPATGRHGLAWWRGTERCRGWKCGGWNGRNALALGMCRARSGLPFGRPSGSGARSSPARRATPRNSAVILEDHTRKAQSAGKDLLAGDFLGAGTVGSSIVKVSALRGRQSRKMFGLLRRSSSGLGRISLWMTPSRRSTCPVNLATNQAKGCGLTTRYLLARSAECVERRSLSATEARRRNRVVASLAL